MSKVTVADLPKAEELSPSDMTKVDGGSRVVGGEGGSLADPGVADIAVANGADPLAVAGAAAEATWYSTFGVLLGAK